MPEHNFAGWLATTLSVYALTELICRRLGTGWVGRVQGLYGGLPTLLYALVALDRVLLPSLPELRIVAAFGMGFVALLALLRLALTRHRDRVRPQSMEMWGEAPGPCSPCIIPCPGTPPRTDGAATTFLPRR